MKILLATDGSEHSKAAYEKLVEMNLSAGTEILIVSVFDPIFSIVAPPASPAEAKSYYEKHKLVDRNLAEEAVNEAAEYLRNASPDLKVTTSVAEGIPQKVILSKAGEKDIDLIVVGSRGRGGIKRLFLGSVSQAVAGQARCSVEIIRQRNPK